MRQHQFDERDWRGGQSVIFRGVRQDLIEHTLITRTGENSFTVRDDAAATESLQWTASAIMSRPGQQKSGLGKSSTIRAFAARRVRTVNKFGIGALNRASFLEAATVVK